MDSAIEQFWNSRFGQNEFVYGTEPNAFLREVAQSLAAPADILSLGEGEGRNSVYLARQGHRVTAVDIAVEGLSKIRRLAGEHGVMVDTVHADLADYTIEHERWHAVVSIFCHVRPPLRERLFAAIMRGLKPGGVLILEAYTPRQLDYDSGGPKELDLLYEPESVRAALSYLEVERCVEVEREVREGRFHTGSAAVVQVLARKPVG